jgi:hypothetical protein
MGGKPDYDASIDMTFTMKHSEESSLKGLGFVSTYRGYSSTAYLCEAKLARRLCGGLARGQFGGAWDSSKGHIFW